MTAPGLEMLDVGALTTVQDRGRYGFAHLGVPRSGALDGPAARLANRLVGNGPEAAVLETTSTGCVVRATGPLLVAVTGATCPVFVGSVPAPFASPVRLAAGQTLEIGPPHLRMRSYLAVRGGIAVEAVLGSRSTDTLSGLGPAPLIAGVHVPVGPADHVTEEEFATLREFARQSRHSRLGSPPLALPIRLGPRDEWFTPEALQTLLSSEYTVSLDSNRVGLRLSGPPLTRAIEGEIASEGVGVGAVQVPPSGEPVVFLADHPTTGGYPVVGVIDAKGIAAAAQASPGDLVRFALVDD